MLTKTGNFLNLVGTRNFLVAIYDYELETYTSYMHAKKDWIMNGGGLLRFKC